MGFAAVKIAKRDRIKAGLLVGGSLLSLLAVPAMGQTVSDVIRPPVVETVTSDGYELLSRGLDTFIPYGTSSGPLSIDEIHLEVGRADDSSHMTYTKSIRGPSKTNWNPNVIYYGQFSNLSSGISVTNGEYGSTIYSAKYIGVYKIFVRSNSNINELYDYYKSGARLVFQSSASLGTLYDRDGIKVNYDYGVFTANDGKYPSKIEKPNGSIIYYTYESAGTIQADACVNINIPQTNNCNVPEIRINRIVNSFGYGFKFYYLNPSVGGSYIQAIPMLDKHAVVRVESIFTNCITYSIGCNDVFIGKVDYTLKRMPTRNGAGFATGLSPFWSIHTLTDSNENVKTFNFFDSPTQASITNSGANVPKIKFDAMANTFQTPDGITSYAVTNSEILYPSVEFYNYLRVTTTKTDPRGAKTSYVVEDLFNSPEGGWNTVSRLVKIIDPLGRTTKMQYDDIGRTTGIIYPEGNSVSVVYDDRSNVLERKSVPKPGSGLTETKETAQFSASCDNSNYRICNKPDFRIDPKLGRTDYVWSAAHGQMLSMLGPPDSNGNRPQTTFDYNAFTGIGGEQIWLLTGKTQKISPTETVTTNYTYNGIDKGLSLKETVTISQGTVIRTCYGYNQSGRKISETKPSASVSSCP